MTFRAQFANLHSLCVRLHPLAVQQLRVSAYAAVRVGRVLLLCEPDANDVARDAALLPSWMRRELGEKEECVIEPVQELERADENAVMVRVVQVCGAHECEEQSLALLFERQWAARVGDILATPETVFALRVQAAVCVFRVQSVCARSGADQLDDLRVVSGRSGLTQMPLPRSLRLAVDELMQSLSGDAKRRALLGARVAGHKVAVLYGSRGAGKTCCMLALLERLAASELYAAKLVCGDMLVGERDSALERILWPASDQSDAVRVILIDNVEHCGGGALWRAVQTLSERANGRWCAVVSASSLASVPTAFVGASVTLRVPTYDAVASEWLPLVFDERRETLAARLRTVRSGHRVSELARADVLQRSGDERAAQRSAAALDPWRDVAGYESVRDELRELVEWPLTHRDAFKRLGIEPARGVLLHGPSGCGKTLLAKALLASLPFPVYECKASDLLSRYLGGTERAIRALFAKARRAAPSVLWLDEIDALAGKRANMGGDGDGDGQDDAVSRRALSALLAEMDGVASRQGVLVLAATSRLQAVDAALLRPGRFDRALKVALPSVADCRAILRHRLRGVNHSVDVERVAALARGQTCAALVNWHRQAVFDALHNGQATLDTENFTRVVTGRCGASSSL